jgi:glutathione S-transferase
MAGSDATLYTIPGSHACMAGELMVRHKRIPFRRKDLISGMHPVEVRLRGFSAKGGARDLGGDRRTIGLWFADRMGTVPALRFDNGERVQTNMAIARRLEERYPEPSLYPPDPERRAAVEEAQAWGNDPFQMVARRLTLAAVLHGRDALHQRGDDGPLGPLLFQSQTMRRIGTNLFARRIFKANPATEREMLDQLPTLLDRIDAWMAAGVLAGDELNAADHMIAPSVALLAYRQDLSPQIMSRPAGHLIDRVFPA